MDQQPPALTELRLAEALDHLRGADAALGRVLADNDPGIMDRLMQPCEHSSFYSLARCIVGQQLCGAAARTIFQRIVDLCGGDAGVTPERILRAPEAELRAAGLSAAKHRYVTDLARHFAEGTLSEVKIHSMDDDVLEEALSAVKGVGQWTVHMFMMFTLKRPDVLPTGDLVVRKGFAKLYGLSGPGGKKAKALPTPEQMRQVSECWRPFRSVGSYLMWHVQDTALIFEAPPGPPKVGAAGASAPSPLGSLDSPRLCINEGFRTPSKTCDAHAQPLPEEWSRHASPKRRKRLRRQPVQ